MRNTEICQILAFFRHSWHPASRPITVASPRRHGKRPQYHRGGVQAITGKHLDEDLPAAKILRP